MPTITHIILTCNANPRGGTVSLQCQRHIFLAPQVMTVNQQINIPINMAFSPSAQVVLTIVTPSLPNTTLSKTVYASPPIQQEIFKTIFSGEYTVDCYVT